MRILQRHRAALSLSLSDAYRRSRAVFLKVSLPCRIGSACCIIVAWRRCGSHRQRAPPMLAPSSSLCALVAWEHGVCVGLASGVFCAIARGCGGDRRGGPRWVHGGSCAATVDSRTPRPSEHSVGGVGPCSAPRCASEPQRTPLGPRGWERPPRWRRVDRLGPLFRPSQRCWLTWTTAEEGSATAQALESGVQRQ